MTTSRAGRLPCAFAPRCSAAASDSGIFIGPFVAAGLLQLFGSESAAIWFFLGCLVVMVVLVLFGPDPEKMIPPVPSTTHERYLEDSGEAVSGSIPTIERLGIFQTMWRQRAVLGRLGLAAASLSAVRSARDRWCLPAVGNCRWD